MKSNHLLRVMMRSGESLWYDCTLDEGRGFVAKYQQWLFDRSPDRGTAALCGPDFCFLMADVIAMSLRLRDVPASERIAKVAEESLKLHKADRDGDSWKGGE